MMHESPGSIRNQIGRQLWRIGDQIEQADVDGMWNHTRFLVTLATPYIHKLPPDEKAKFKLNASVADGYEECNRVIEEVLRILAENNIYAWTTPDIGDASKIALKDEDEEGTEVLA